MGIRLTAAFALNAEENIARRLIVHGRVQGVGFRYFAQKTASALGVGGSVRNRADGTVEIYAVGSAELLDQLSAHLKRGPSLARVERIEEREASAVEWSEFRVVS